MESRVLGSGPPVPGAPDPALDVRKTITIIFVDIVDSERLSIALDPEALRNLLARYFDEMSAVIRRHGGAVDTYIGDAIMAVFGVPILHEDDALRAVRAAVEMRDTLAILNREFEAGWGVRLANRIGVNTGEVITRAQGHLSVTGEAITVAKRLEAAAAANEILIGEPTHRLVRDAVVVESSGPRTLKNGKTIHALTVVKVLAHASGNVRRFDSPFVARARERAMLEAALGNVIRNRTCHLLTVLGGAGVGKSRLVWEFAGRSAGDVTVLRGRCLPYGEGITYWPLAEIVREIARAEGRDPGEQFASAIAARLAGEEKAELIVERFGIFDFALAVVVCDGRLELVLRGWRCLGLPLPRSWAPRGDAYEMEAAGRFHFSVAISHPLCGLIVRYEGWLDPPQPI